MSVDQVKREPKESMHTNHSSYYAYGCEMAIILDRINSEKRWIEKPRGPLASCITVNVRHISVFSIQLLTLTIVINNLFTLQDPIWVHLVEFILGPYLCSFAVDNKEDKMLLDDIVDGVFKQFHNKDNIVKPSICLMPFGDDVSRFISKTGSMNFSNDYPIQKIYIPSQEPQCGYLTVLNVLDITGNDYVVFNWLVDVTNVERILLFTKYDDACEFMKKK